MYLKTFLTLSAFLGICFICLEFFFIDFIVVAVVVVVDVLHMFFFFTDLFPVWHFKPILVVMLACCFSESKNLNGASLHSSILCFHCWCICNDARFSTQYSNERRFISSVIIIYIVNGFWPQSPFHATITAKHRYHLLKHNDYNGNKGKYNSTSTCTHKIYFVLSISVVCVTLFIRTSLFLVYLQQSACVFHNAKFK